MNLQKFTADNTRDCLKKMRAALGADAMIVSTRKTKEGIEIVGASANELYAAHDALEPFSGNTHSDDLANGYSLHALPGAGAQRRANSIYQEQSQQDIWEDDEDSVNLSPAARVLAETSHADLGHSDTDWEEDETEDESLPVHPENGQLMYYSNPETKRKSNTGKSLSDSLDRTQTLPIVGNAESETEKALRAAMDKFSDENAEQFDDHMVEDAANDAHLMSAHVSKEEIVDPIIEEVRQMRTWLEQQMQALKWKDTTLQAPIKRQVWYTLASAGFSPMLARNISQNLPDNLSTDKVGAWLHEVLEKNIRTVPSAQSMAEKGGVYALVGPTGVGKTTTVAKIAARCVVKYGAQALGLITTDQYRIGAVDQLRTYGRILGVDVYTVRSGEDLTAMLEGMTNRKLVIIDTTGIGQKDVRLEEQLEIVNSPVVQRLLVLPATTPVEQAEDCIQAYYGTGIDGILVTKLDEAVRIGGVLDVAIRHRLPLHYLTTGQRVPEDLHVANLQLVVHRALHSQQNTLIEMEDQELDWISMPNMSNNE